MKTKKLNKKNKKVSPSVYFLIPIFTCLFIISAYLYDTSKILSGTNFIYKVSEPLVYGKEIHKGYSNAFLLEDTPLEEKFYCLNSESPYIELEKLENAPVEEAKDIEPYVEPVYSEPVHSYVPAVPPEAMGDSNVEAILARTGMTYEEFYTVVAIVAAEGGGSYTDAYAVASVIFNRARCSRWVYSAYNQGLNGQSMYGQAVLPGQFSVYASGSYLNHMYEVGTNAYNAVVTILTNYTPMHNYLSFRSANSGIAGVQFIQGGNIYFTELQPWEIM